MNVTKYADLSQSLAESEKQLCDKIAEECANNFIIEINDSLTEIKEVVNKIQSCKDSYEKAAEVVGKLSTTLTETEEKVTGLNCKLTNAGEQADSAARKIEDKTQVIVSQANRFSELLLNNAAEVTGLIKSQNDWKKTCEDSISDIATKVDAFVSDLEGKQRVISSDTETIQNCKTVIESCVNDVKKCTEDYTKTMEESNSKLMKSFDLFKNDFITAYKEQNRMIDELKAEQLKFRKMYLLGIIPAAIIIVLQIVNIMC